MGRGEGPPLGVGPSPRAVVLRRAVVQSRVGPVAALFPMEEGRVVGRPWRSRCVW